MLERANKELIMKEKEEALKKAESAKQLQAIMNKEEGALAKINPEQALNYIEKFQWAITGLVKRGYAGKIEEGKQIGEQEAKLCGICYTRSKERVLGCGHTICQICLDNMDLRGDKRCPHCRVIMSGQPRQLFLQG